MDSEAAMQRHLQSGAKKQNVKMRNVHQRISSRMIKTYSGHPALLLSHTRMAPGLHKHWRGVPHGRLVVAVVEVRVVICFVIVVIEARVVSGRVAVEAEVYSEMAIQRHLKWARELRCYRMKMQSLFGRSIHTYIP